MKRTNPKLAQVVLEKLGLVPHTIGHIIDEAIVLARKYFEDRELKINNFLFPSLVRYEASLLLDSPAYKSIGYQFVSLSNNGLFIIYLHEGCYYRIRVRKADEEGELPVQNLSKTLKDFLSDNNEPLLPSIEGHMDDFISPDRLNLVIVWDVDKHFVLQSVDLVCPKNEYGEVYFADKIDHAATIVVGNADFDEWPDDIDDIGDIDIGHNKTGTDNS